MFRSSEIPLRKWLVVVALAMVALLSATEARAQGGPAPDPAGLATGDRTSVTDASGTSFLVTEPTDQTAPDFAERKKAFDEFQAAAAKEPLALKLADSVGHVKIGTNTAWTLGTGYLVLFMQAGFALLTAGLVRRKNAAHLMMLFAAHVFAMLAYFAVGISVWSGCINAAPANIGGTPTLNHFWLAAAVGDFSAERVLPVRPAYDATRDDVPVPVVLWKPPA